MLVRVRKIRYSKKPGIVWIIWIAKISSFAIAYHEIFFNGALWLYPQVCLDRWSFEGFPSALTEMRVLLESSVFRHFSQIVVVLRLKKKTIAFKKKLNLWKRRFREASQNFRSISLHYLKLLLFPLFNPFWSLVSFKIKLRKGTPAFGPWERHGASLAPAWAFAMTTKN